MFRKPSKKKKPSKIRKRGDEGEDEEEDLSLQDKIRSTQKKQKILGSLPLVTGNPSRRSIKKSPLNDAINTDNGTGEMTVMEKKNHQLMQEYIEKEMNQDKPTGSNNPNSGSNTNEDEAKATGATDEETLYQELAKEVYSLKQHENQQVQEERGAVLVGGTGLAEVILPASHTGSDNSKSNQQKKSRVYRKNASSSAVPALQSSVSTANLNNSGPQFRNFQQHRRAPMAPQQDKDAEATTAGNEKSSGDADRVGFNAYRGKPAEKKTIVKKQRDDSMFSDFVKHQRQKMMNRR